MNEEYGEEDAKLVTEERVEKAEQLPEQDNVDMDSVKTLPERSSNNKSYSDSYEEIQMLSQGNFLVKSRADSKKYSAFKSTHKTLTNALLADFQFHKRLRHTNLTHAKDYFFEDSSSELIVIGEYTECKSERHSFLFLVF